MEDALRWGVEHIFSRQPYTTQPQSQDTAAPTAATAAASPHGRDDTKIEDAHSPRSPGHMAQEAGMAAAESIPSPRGKPPSASPEPSMKSPFGSPEQQQQQPKSHSKLSATNSSSVFQPVYTDTVVKKVVEWSVAQSQQVQARGGGEDKGSGDGGVGVGAQSLEEVLGPGWSCVKLHEWQQGQLDDNAQADAGERLPVFTVYHVLLVWRDAYVELPKYGYNMPPGMTFRFLLQPHTARSVYAHMYHCDLSCWGHLL